VDDLPPYLLYYKFVKRKSSDAHKVTPKKKYENLFGHNNNILVRKRFGKSMPRKGQGELSTYTGTFTRPKKIKK
jgi:hypothetical protein